MSDLTDWIQAVGTTAAVALSGGLLVHEVRARNRERRDGESAQIRQLRITKPIQPEPHGETMHVAWKIDNYSTEPAVLLRVGLAWFTDERHAEAIYNRKVLPPGGCAEGAMIIDRSSYRRGSRVTAHVIDSRSLSWTVDESWAPQRLIERPSWQDRMTRWRNERTRRRAAIATRRRSLKRARAERKLARRGLEAAWPPPPPDL